MIRGWANYHRDSGAKATFQYVDHCIFKALWSWAKRRHPLKGKRWVKARYFRSYGPRHWVFSADFRDHRGRAATLKLISASDVAIKRHVKIRGAATRYDPHFIDYFAQRDKRAPDRDSDL